MSTPADGLPLTRQRRDPVEWDGRCIFCVSGEVKRWATDDDLDEETGP